MVVVYPSVPGEMIYSGCCQDDVGVTLEDMYAVEHSLVWRSQYLLRQDEQRADADPTQV